MRPVPLSFAAFFLPHARTYAMPVAAPSAALCDAQHLALAARLEQICAPLLHLEFALHCHTQTYGLFPGEPPQQLHGEFLTHLATGGWEELLARRPVLGQWVNRVVAHWRAAVTEFFGRLAHDADALCATFGVAGEPTDIRLGISDAHNGGRSAAILTFADGRHLVYKPKDLSPDSAWRELAHWLKRNDAPWCPTAPGVLARLGYGWTSFVETRPCVGATQEQAFFSGLGSLLGLLYLLGASDCHRENFVVCGTEPVLVDLETLLNPPPPGDAMPAALRDSVLAVEMLPCRYIGAGEQEICFPGFDGEREANDGATVAVATPALSLRTHAQVFSDGFAVMYRFLTKHKAHLSDLDAGPLAAFRGCTVRYVHRPTMTYALILRRAMHHLHAGTASTASFERMHRYDPPGLADATAAVLRAAEHAALERLDIPYFTARSDATDLYWDNDRQADFFAASALDLVRQRVERLSAEDLVRQTEAIQKSLSQKLSVPK